MSDGSLKGKRESSQTSCQLVHEAEEETGFSGQPQVDGASQEAGSCKSIVFLVNDSP